MVRKCVRTSVLFLKTTQTTQDNIFVLFALSAFFGI